MQCLNTIRTSALRLHGCAALPIRPRIDVPCTRLYRKSTHRTIPVVKRPCFDLRNVTVIPGTDCHSRMITWFMNTHYWPREPSVIGLWLPLSSPYLEFLTAKFSHSGERLIAMEYLPRTRERKMIGLTVANRVYPWMVSELEQWGHVTDSLPERYRMYFCAHCFSSPNLFKKYNVDYIYDIEVLGTSAEVTGQGVGKLLLQAAIASAHDMRHPLIQVVAVSSYAAKICEKCGMTKVWSMEYKDFIDKCGQSVFYPRSPHYTVAIYVKYFEPGKGGQVKCKPPY
ncbi:hypothetical protein PYW07_015682 [Mythimna separata]|uniref:N-acetyltransferase domain-containing protein n=1 Tax=Mythimna separata TaxID=271217 RepID=A0AAD7YSA6_MYTSE|nr:hypothetical protein PYW07_015682 [Mythimna separata]